MTEQSTLNKETAETENLGFEAEVSRLLHMMVHSVYSDREIFLRELISNASDACDKLRYESQQDASLTADGADFGITITVDKDAKTITVADNGIGMNRDDLIANLGTIAKSGTAGFMDKLTGDTEKDVQLIGQFGVGFYSVFMVAASVQVTTKRAGDTPAWLWESTGEGSYSITEVAKESRGTEIVLHLKEDAEEFLEQYRLTSIVKTYSDHIAVPIALAIKGGDAADDEAEADAGPKTINEGSAIWTRPKSEITDEQYSEFYRHIGHGFDEPALTLHYKVEGMQEYTVLMFIPESRPMDLFDPARKSRTKLYVKRVFITDDSEDLLPAWLRFLRGVVDSQDLPLNISREMLQNNPTLTRMSKAITKRVVSELEKLADKDFDTFAKIWDAFGSVIKEGIYEDHERRDQLLKLARFKSTGVDGWTTLADYVGRMKDAQSEVYYVTGVDAEQVAKSPQLEGFRSRGIEVLLLSDAVDEFWLQMVPEFDGKPMKSVTRGDYNLDEIGGDTKEADDKKDAVKEGDLTVLTTVMKDVLGDKVQDVRASGRLTSTAACLVADETGMDMHMERILKAHNQLDAISKKILEVNPSHALVKAMAERAKTDGAADALTDAVLLMFDQAKILEGEQPDDAAAFARRLSVVMAKGL